ncbi:hypothetical protein Tsubulata_029051 [Turnera subulata]|uniref:Protein kinase domain-containing protein n=1 Tax=Turnera subulata TaxID=218843 RepID=A0A9Q0J2I6_9ROSI|nr:hypothetical protein Tsubulata_029051 [Turnera subulata]
MLHAYSSSSSSSPHLLLLISFYTILAATASSSRSPPLGALNLLQPYDATALLDFKSRADLHNKLTTFSQATTPHFCHWQGVTCVKQKVARLVLQDLDLGGVFPPNTLTRLDQLRVLSLQNNSLAGPIPDLSRLLNLKSLFLDHNFFSGSFPLSLLPLHRLRTLDLSYNNLTGNLTSRLSSLDRLLYLRLDNNRFNGSIPALNQTSLTTFNVSFNNFSGAVPVTPTMLRFDVSSFLSNPSLCGEIIHKECHPSPPFFGPASSSSSSVVAPPPAIVNGALHGVDLTQPSQRTNHKRSNALIIGFSSAVVALIGSLICFVIAAKKQKTMGKKSTADAVVACGDDDRDGVHAEAAAVMQIDQQESELEEKVKRVQGMHAGKSGSLVFCAGEAHVYSLDQLMRASAELLGRGTMGTTYKAVLDNRLIVTVKRLDAVRLAGTSKDVFEQHMESVGGLRHPNLVPLRAYFQAKEERLLIYDYQPNGSLFSLIHGSKSTRAKPLHWTSCLKISEDVAQGLSYIHQAWRLVHGNLKSSNVLLGPDFEACVADYCLVMLAPNSAATEDDPDTMACKAPESRNSSRQPTAKSDVYAFGVMLLELLTGKPPSQIPLSIPTEEMVNWVRRTRDQHYDHDGDDGNKLDMLLEVAIACSLTSPEQRPTMWQVLKMLQEIKETVLMEDSELDPPQH